MNDDQDKSVSRIKAAPRNPRADRLKAALRENLKRRKSQSRGRNASAALDNDEEALRNDEDRP